jgi:hypothetical protein
MQRPDGVLFLNKTKEFHLSVSGFMGVFNKVGNTTGSSHF